MCRSIKPLFNLSPKVTENEIHEASIQFVRKVSGFRKASKTNQITFDKCVGEIDKSVSSLLQSLQTKSQPRKR